MHTSITKQQIDRGYMQPKNLHTNDKNLRSHKIVFRHIKILLYSKMQNQLKSLVFYANKMYLTSCFISNIKILTLL